MNWRILFSGFALIAGACIAVILAFASVNVALWLAAFATLIVSLLLVFDRQSQYPALVWVVGFNWLGIVAPILAADLVDTPLIDTTLGVYRQQAINLNLIALIVFAFGIALSLRAGGGTAINKDPPGATPAVTVQTAVVGYFLSLLIAEFGNYVVSNIPALQQPVVAVVLTKFIFVYLVAAACFAAGRGYFWLVIILAVEVVSGLTNFFGTFKEAFFLVLIALAAAGRRPSPRMWAFGIAAASLVLVLSVMWTAIKPDYRRWVSGYTGEQIVVRSFEERVGWMADNMLGRDLDTWKAFRDMVDRIDNTFVFAQFLAREDSGDVFNLPSRYRGGIEHVLMPRILFPEKEIIDDSAVTMALTGRVIDRNTSISIGFIAEAYYDFGAGWMFVPVLLIGVTVGAAGRYFMTRNAPYVIRQGFTASAVFNFFQFGINFNKSLGTFLIGFIVFALILRFVYPYVAFWLAGGRPQTARAVAATGVK